MSMSEIEQLRKEVNELRERLAKLEARKDRLEESEWRKFRDTRDDWLRNNPMPHPIFIQEVAKNFPPGTILC
jgi:DNA repair exonuclease SbcCD ATPase subunit